MWKNFGLGLILILFSVYTATAQQVKRQNIEMQPIPAIGAVIVEDMLFTASEDSVYAEEVPDSLLYEASPVPDENLNDIFSEKMDSLGNSWYIKHLFHPGDLENAMSEFYPKNLPDSVYIKRLEEIEQVVDLSYNNTVKNFIVLYTEKRRDLVEYMLGLSAYYFPMFEEELDRHNMPLELKYLPVIESALNPRAMSRMGANGLWQFMYGTARQMDLEITSFVDERRDPVKSTEAAVKYFKHLYNTYDDWYLAIAAYNCGPGNVNRAIRRSGGKRNFWDIYYRLPRETRGYVPAYIAAAYVMNYYKEHNLQPRKPEMPIQTDTVNVHDYLHFNQLEAKLNMEKEQLRALNPMFRRDVIPAKPGKPYPLVLPVDNIMAFIDADTTVFAHEREKYFPNNTLQSPTSATANYVTPADVEGKTKIIYTVKSGDNVGFISEWFNVRASDLRYWNNINRNLIRVGQKLVVYVPEDQKGKYEQLNSMTFTQKQASVGKSAGPVQNATPVSLDPNFEYYTVRRGDTIWEIAKRYAGISPNDILQLNNLSSRSKLSIGQKLKIKTKENI